MTMDQVRIDLVTGSIGKLSRLSELLTSLDALDRVGLRCIVIEQRDLASVRKLVDQYRVPTVVIESAPGLSHARNVGLKLADGDIIGFPDDDCQYQKDTLSRVVAAFVDDSVDIVIGRQIDSLGRNVLDSRPAVEKLDSCNVWRSAMSSAIFVRREVVDRIGGFDTALGVGSEGRYQSGEETDFILRALAAGFAGIYDPSITINHPSPSEIPGRMSSRLARGYGRGMGHVLWLHDEPPLRSCWRVVRPILGAVVAILRADFALASFRAFSGVGRAEGRWRRKSKSEVACRKLRRESSSLNSDVSIAGSTEKRDAP